MVIGIRHPSKHLRGRAIQALRSEGVQVDVLGEDLQSDVVEVFFLFDLLFKICYNFCLCTLRFYLCT